MTEREGETKRDLHSLITPQMIAGTRSPEARSQELHPGLTHVWKGPSHLGHEQSSLIHEQRARCETEEPEFNFALQ